MNEPNSMLSRMFSPAGEYMYNCNKYCFNNSTCTWTTMYMYNYCFAFLGNLPPSFTTGAPYSKFEDEYRRYNTYFILWQPFYTSNNYVAIWCKVWDWRIYIESGTAEKIGTFLGHQSCTASSEWFPNISQFQTSLYIMLHTWMSDKLVTTLKIRLRFIYLLIWC